MSHSLCHYGSLADFSEVKHAPNKSRKGMEVCIYSNKSTVRLTVGSSEDSNVPEQLPCHSFIYRKKRDQILNELKKTYLQQLVVTSDLTALMSYRHRWCLWSPACCHERTRS